MVTRGSLIYTKLAPSYVRNGYLSRPRLLDALAAHADCPLVLVSAPAGSGKTTLLHDGVRRNPSAWITLDSEDRDEPVFVHTLLEALHRAYPGSVDASRLQGPGDHLQTTLVNELMDYPGVMRLVLDDLHKLEGAALEWVRFLVKRGPANLRLLLSTRGPAPFRLSRLRAEGRLFVPDARDLTFTESEAAELFQHVSIEPAALRGLLEKCGGWATALQLALAAARRGLDPYAGSFEHIRDFVAHEVLEPLPEEIQAFLLRTSACERLSATHRLDAGFEEVADYLRHHQLFVFDDHDGLRYQTLFRECLRRHARASSEAAPAVAVSEPHLEILAFGSLQLRYAGRPVELYVEARPQVVRLLKLLLCEGDRTLSIDRILDTLWPQADPIRARNNLSVHLASLRKLLRIERALPLTGDGYRLNLGRTLTFDVVDFERHARAGRQHSARREVNEARAAFERAEQLYTAPFLCDDLYDDAVHARRTALEHQLVVVTDWLAQDAFHRGDVDAAAQRYRRLLAGDSMNESTFIKLCQCHRQTGDRMAADRDLGFYRDRLKHEGGYEPRADALALVRSI